MVGTYSRVTVGGRCGRVADDGWRPGSNACADVWLPSSALGAPSPACGRRAERFPRLVRSLIGIRPSSPVCTRTAVQGHASVQRVISSLRALG
ncbi:hypothetical protein XFF7767_450016 [Xanthomonas citri pv. fuscans]|nr:hypothetical protein XFF7767_450016 [Xanthomonas citri pv. fuscans]SOO15262.1 hypothetical protein XFF7766_510049 [Xanthomonas citri pv. fuscans]SOO42805.1 hypothetical protein XFF1815_270049 [Xanthomonas citri pv. fuscans]